MYNRNLKLVVRYSRDCIIKLKKKNEYVYVYVSKSRK